MKLFERRDFQLKVAPEVFTLKPFKDLDKRDRTVDKNQLERDLAFIYFVYDPRSDLQYIVNEDERIDRTKEVIGADNKFKIDATLQKAIDTYKLMTKTTSSLLLEDIKVSIDKIRTYLRTAQIDDDTFSKYIDSVNKLIPLSEKVSIAEKKVSREIEDLVELRGAKSQTILDGGFGNFMK